MLLSTTLSHQILSGKLLLVTIGGQKNNLSCEFELESITTLLIICCKIVVKVALSFILTQLIYIYIYIDINILIFCIISLLAQSFKTHIHT